MSYLNKKHNNKENILVHFKNLHPERLKVIFNEFQEMHIIYASELNYRIPQPFYTANQISKSLDKFGASETTYFIVENAFWLEHFRELQRALMRRDISLIFSTLPSNYSISSLGRKL